MIVATKGQISMAINVLDIDKYRKLGYDVVHKESAPEKEEDVPEKKEDVPEKKEDVPEGLSVEENDFTKSNFFERLRK